VTIAAVAVYDRIQSELVDARRRRDHVVLGTLSLLKSELVKASKETGSVGTIDDDLVVRIARKDIEEIQPSRVSIMPAGLDQQLSPQELADLVAFLKACQ